MARALSPGQAIAMIAIGAVLWGVFVLVVRAIPFALDGGLANALLFLAAFPVSWLSIALARRLASLERSTLFEAVSIATAAAMFLDGVVFTFLPHWYGDAETHVRRGAGFILWGAAAGMAIAWLLQRGDAAAPPGSRASR